AGGGRGEIAEVLRGDRTGLLHFDRARGRTHVRDGRSRRRQGSGGGWRGCTTALSGTRAITANDGRSKALHAAVFPPIPLQRRRRAAVQGRAGQNSPAAGVAVG